MSRYLRGAALWQQVETVAATARANGALYTLVSRCVQRQENCAGRALSLQLRVLEATTDKPRPASKRGAFTPFLQPDPQHYIGELSERYRCLLNCFNVVDRHILMVTTHYVGQRTPLTPDDFLAAAICLQAANGLVFYNGGSEAGASVEHKHLQMLPLPLLPSSSFPLAALFAELAPAAGAIVQTALPFAHRLAATTAATGDSEAALIACAEANWHRYRAMLAALQLAPAADGLMPPHNLLMTRDYLWLVPRRRGSYRGLEVNALGYAGALLVRGESQYRQLQRLGCLGLLQAVGCSAAPA